MLLPALLLAACQPGSEGPLDPVPATGVRRGEASNGEPFAVVDAGAQNARISGRWRSQSAPTLDIEYANRGRTPITLQLKQTAFRGEGRAANLGYVRDMTGVDARSTDPARHVPRPLIRGKAADIESVTIAPGETRSLAFEFATFPPERSLDSGDQVTIDVPSGAKPVRVVFRCASPFGWPF